jgi:hypothetical protein
MRTDERDGHRFFLVAIFVKSQWSCTYCASHANMFKALSHRYRIYIHRYVCIYNGFQIVTNSNVNNIFMISGQNGLNAVLAWLIGQSCQM